MKLKQLIVFSGIFSSLMSAAYAQEVKLITNQPTTISFQVIHQNQNSPEIAGEVRTLSIDKSHIIPIAIQEYQIAGIKVLAINGHELPLTTNRFNQPQQCSMAIDANKTQGTIEFIIDEHEIKCSTQGSILG